MKATTQTYLSLALCATILGSAQAKDTRVLWLNESGQTAIHRFNVMNVGEADETWEETTPLATYETSKSICNVLPAHGG